MKSDFTLAFNEILETRALSKEIVLEALQQALVSAYRRDANVGSSQQRIEAQITPDGQPRIFVEKEVVDDVLDDRTEVAIANALRVNPDCQLGDMVMMPIESHTASFGRIAAQTAKQVILQRIREAERETLYGEFIERAGDLITGTVQSTSGGVVTLSLGRAEAIMPKQHQIPNEKYRQHEKVRTYLVEVNKGTRGPQIIVSRTHKDMLRRLLEYEVPEIYNGQIEIKNIAREAGFRSKVAVVAMQEGVDPVGACVGMRGMRIQNIIKELSGEKIDVIEWDPDPAKYIAKALSPARVSGVYVDREMDHLRMAVVIVPDNELSLAIGKEGQNARLAAKLTGWRIDIKSVTEASFENFRAVNDAHSQLASLPERYADLIAEVARILDKKTNNRAVTPEEFTTLTRFVDIAESSKLKDQIAERLEREARIDAVRGLVPPRAFEIPLTVLELADDITQALSPRVDNVGELMIRILADEEYLRELLLINRAGEDAMDAIRYALDDLVIPEIMVGQGKEEMPAGESAPIVETAPMAALPPQPEVAEEEEIPPAYPEAVVAAKPAPEAEVAVPVRRFMPEPDTDFEQEAAFAKRRKAGFAEIEEDEGEIDPDDDATKREGGKKKGKKGKQRRVELVFDEDLGEVVAKRRRKGNRRRDDFEEDELEDYR